MKKLNLLLPALFVNFSAHAIVINEDTLVKWAREENINNSRIELQKLNQKLSESSFNENFQTTLATNYSYTASKETTFSQYAVVNSPLKVAQVVLTKPTTYGVQAQVKASTNQVSNSFYKSGTTASFGASLAFDLYKDLLGKTSRANVESLSLKSEIAEKENEITKHAFVQDVRKLYWSLVANNESLTIAKNLFETAKKLEEDTKKRFANSVADKGELARTQSQVEARHGQVLILEFERSEIFKRLRQLFPEKLNDNSIELGKYSLDKTVMDVLACTTNINSKVQTPFEYTKYDEILELLKRDLELSQKVNNSHSQIDAKLITEMNYIGKKFSHADAIDELKDDGREQYSIGFQLNIPLDGKKKDTQKIQEEIIQKSNVAKYQEIEGKLNAFHTQTVQSIDVLYKVIAAQQRNAKYLDETLKTSKTKFKQARLSARELIQDEDSLLQSNLNEINTKYNVISTLIDYFSVFSSTPCAINK